MTLPSASTRICIVCDGWCTGATTGLASPQAPEVRDQVVILARQTGCSSSDAGGVMAGRKSWLIAVALCAPVAVVVATCGWAFVRGRPAAFGCTPPAGEEALIAQYRVDPLLQPDTFPAPGTPQPPIIRRSCDNVGAAYAAT